TVSFFDGATLLGTTALSGGVATFTTSTLAVGIHSLTAVYNGSGNFNISTSPVDTQTVTP
ncbi:Ig-like domain-containing protein, partial [Streptomyces sp. NPDC051080]|uniref:Ig-like domain-containing protein n=1 Tax=Streptomyces sp. NPDC051080 TaxID=3157222 RepID=UPI00341FB51E